jgi:hypothetical protein
MADGGDSDATEAPPPLPEWALVRVLATPNVLDLCDLGRVACASSQLRRVVAPNAAGGALPQWRAVRVVGSLLYPLDDATAQARCCVLLGWMAQLHLLAIIMILAHDGQRQLTCTRRSMRCPRSCFVCAAQALTKEFLPPWEDPMARCRRRTVGAPSAKDVFIQSEWERELLQSDDLRHDDMVLGDDGPLVKQTAAAIRARWKCLAQAERQEYEDMAQQRKQHAVQYMASQCAAAAFSRPLLHALSQCRTADSDGGGVHTLNLGAGIEDDYSSGLSIDFWFLGIRAPLPTPHHWSRPQPTRFELTPGDPLLRGICANWGVSLRIIFLGHATLAPADINALLPACPSLVLLSASGVKLAGGGGSSSRSEQLFGGISPVREVPCLRVPPVRECPVRRCSVRECRPSPRTGAQPVRTRPAADTNARARMR